MKTINVNALIKLAGLVLAVTLSGCTNLSQLFSGVNNEATNNNQNAVAIQNQIQYVVDSKSDNIDLTAGGDTKILWVKIKNISQTEWVTYDPAKLNPYLLRLGTAVPYDRASYFYVQDNWIAPNRTHWADEKTVPTQGIMNIGFKVSAPTNLLGGEYNECFALVVEQAGYVPGPAICWKIKVTNPNDKSLTSNKSAINYNTKQQSNYYPASGNMSNTNSGYGGYGYDTSSYYPYSADSYGGDYGYDGYGGSYADQTYQDIYENRMNTNNEINENTSQWLYDGEANYINPETGELESKDYTNGDWYQTSDGDQYQTDDSSYTPDYSYEQQMEQYSGWASDYNPSDYGYDSGYDSGGGDYYSE